MSLWKTCIYTYVHLCMVMVHSHSVPSASTGGQLSAGCRSIMTFLPPPVLTHIPINILPETNLGPLLPLRLRHIQHTMSQPLDDSPEASSSTAAEKAISTLRARLRSEDPFPPPLHASASSSEPCMKHNDIYKQLRATFSSLPGPQPAPHHTPDRGNAIMSNLAGSHATPRSNSWLAN